MGLSRLFLNSFMTYVPIGTSDIKELKRDQCAIRFVKKLISKTISCNYCTVRSKFKDFIQIKRAVVIDKIERHCIYALLNSLLGNQFIDLNSVRHMINFIWSKVKLYAFILHSSYFLFFW